MNFIDNKQLSKTFGILLLFLLISNRMDAIEDFAEIKSPYLQQTVTGVVSSEDNMPLAGVSVFEKGTNNGTVTDFDGNYTIEITGSYVN